MSNILKRFATATVGLHLTILSFFIKRSRRIFDEASSLMNSKNTQNSEEDLLYWLLWENPLDELGQLGTVDEPRRKINLEKTAMTIIKKI